MAEKESLQAGGEMAHIRKINSSGHFHTANGVDFRTVGIELERLTVRISIPSRGFSPFSTVGISTPYIEYAIPLGFFRSFLLLK